MEIRIRYFASLREITERGEETLKIAEGGSITTAREALVTRYPKLQTILGPCLCAVNHQYVRPETELHEGDELVFIPPMGGGA